MSAAAAPSPPAIGAPDADDVVAVKTPFLDVLLLTVVILLLRAVGPVPAHALEIEPPAVGGTGAVPLVEAETPVVVGLDVRRQVTVDDRPTDLDGVAAVLESYEQPAALVRVDGTLPTTATLDLVARIRPVVRSVQIQVVPSPDPR